MVLANLTPLPADYLYPDNDKDKDNIKKFREDYNKDPINKGGKWWSMYDLMRYFHGGFIPEEGDTNYIRFELDLTNPELKVAGILDPKLVQEINNKINPVVQEFSSKIQALISEMKLKATTDLASVAARQQGPVMVAAAAGGGFKRKNKKSRKFGGGDAISDLIAPDNLKQLILNSISGLEFTSLDRIFITNSVKGKLGLVSDLGMQSDATATANALNPAAAVAPAAAPPAPAAVGGRRYKTRKLRRSKKYGRKTHQRTRSKRKLTSA